jgi:hypothetical protein
MEGWPVNKELVRTWKVTIWLKILSRYLYGRPEENRWKLSNDSECEVPLRNTTVVLLDVIHRPVSYLKHNVSETRFCLHLPEIGAGSIDWAQLSRFYLKTETEFSLRKFVLRRQGLALSIGNWVGFYLKTETESSLRNVVFPDMGTSSIDWELSRLFTWRQRQNSGSETFF